MEALFENEIALVLIVKNESPYIGEWLEYHYRIGVDKFYIYNNDSEDRAELLKILDPWIKSGVVDFEDAPGKFRQMPVYNDAIERHRFDCRYMGFIDTDEFIYVKTGQSLPEFLNEHFSQSQMVAGLSMNWRMFGSSGKEFYEPIDVIERFTHRAKDDYRDNRHVKVIVNPRKILYMPLPHNAQYMLYCECCDEKFRFIRDPISKYNSCNKIQLNHYYTKSVEEYAQKCSRGRADCPMVREKNAALNSELNALEDVELRDFWRQLKRTHLPKPKDHSQKKILENLKTMLASTSTEDQVVKLLTCFFTITRCDLISADEKLSIRNYVLEILTDSISKKASIVNITLLLAVIPHILRIKLPATRNFLNVFKKYMPRLILEYQNELEDIVEFHARHMLAILELI